MHRNRVWAEFGLQATACQCTSWGILKHCLRCVRSWSPSFPLCCGFVLSWSLAVSKWSPEPILLWCNGVKWCFLLRACAYLCGGWTSLISLCLLCLYPLSWMGFCYERTKMCLITLMFSWFSRVTWWRAEDPKGELSVCGCVQEPPNDFLFLS